LFPELFSPWSETWAELAIPFKAAFYALNFFIVFIEAIEATALVELSFYSSSR